jgi:hypothetical protein
LHREQETLAPAGRVPADMAILVVTECAAGYQRMHMQMAPQILRPGV